MFPLTIPCWYWGSANFLDTPPVLPPAGDPGGAGFQDRPFLARPVWSESHPVSHRYVPLAPMARLVPPTLVTHGSEPGYCRPTRLLKSPEASLTVMPSTAARSSTPSHDEIMLSGTGMKPSYHELVTTSAR